MTLCIFAELPGQYAICSDCYLSMEGIHLHDALEGAMLDSLTTPIIDRTIESQDNPGSITIIDEVRKSVILNKKSLLQFSGETRYFKPFLEKFEFYLEEQIDENLGRKLVSDFKSTFDSGKLSVIACCVDKDLKVKTAFFGKYNQYELNSGSRITLIGSGGIAPNSDNIIFLANQVEEQLQESGILNGQYFSELLSSRLLFDEVLHPEKHQNLGYGDGYDTAYIKNNGEWTFGSNSTYLFANVINVSGYIFVRFFPIAIFQTYLDDSTIRLSTNITIQDIFGEYYYLTKFGITTQLNCTSLVRSYDPIGPRIELDKSFSPLQNDRIVLCIREFSMPDDFFQRKRAGEHDFTIQYPKGRTFGGSGDRVGSFQIFGGGYNSEENSLQLKALIFEPNLDNWAEYFNVEKVYGSPKDFPAEFEEFADLIADMQIPLTGH